MQMGENCRGLPSPEVEQGNLVLQQEQRRRRTGQRFSLDSWSGPEEVAVVLH